MVVVNPSLAISVLIGIVSFAVTTLSASCRRMVLPGLEDIVFPFHSLAVAWRLVVKKHWRNQLIDGKSACSAMMVAVIVKGESICSDGRVS